GIARCVSDTAESARGATGKAPPCPALQKLGVVATGFSILSAFFTRSFPMERVIESLMVRARWLLAPVYLGLSFALIALAIVFFREVWHLFAIIATASEADVVLIVLSLVDISLVGGLLIMVMLSGYENFVSALDTETGGDKRSEERRVGKEGR